jgi:UrcA family protein
MVDEAVITRPDFAADLLRDDRTPSTRQDRSKDMSNSANRRMPRAAKALAIGAATLLFTLSAQAGTERVDTPVKHQDVIVRYADLNLASAEGTQALYARLAAAASRACGGQPGIHQLREQQDYRACYQKTLEKAVRKIDSQRLQALHAERSTTRSVG